MGTPVQRKHGPTGNWMRGRKIKLYAGLLVILALTVLLQLPYGLTAFASVLWAAFVWHHIGDEADHLNLGFQSPGTRSYKLEVLMTVIYHNLISRAILNPRIYALGSPVDDDDHDVFQGFMPPTRMSGYWALIGSVLLGSLDYFLNIAHYPLWRSVFTIPSVVEAVIGTIGWFALIQFLIYCRSQQGRNSESVGAIEPTPYVMLHRVSGLLKSWNLWKMPVVFMLITAFILTVIMLGVSTPPLYQVAITVPVSILVGLVSVSSKVAAMYRAEWEHRAERRSFYEGVWATAIPNISAAQPLFVTEFDLPTIDPADLEGMTDDELDALDPPQVTSAVFSIPPGTTFYDYTRETALCGALGKDVCAVVPMGKMVTGPDGTPSEKPGTVSNQFFRLWYPVDGVEIGEDFLSPNLNEWARYLLVQAIVMSALRDIRGIGNCTMLSADMITTDDSPQKVMKLEIVPDDPSVDIGNFVNQILALQNIWNVGWVRVMRKRDFPYSPRMKTTIDPVYNSTIILLIGNSKPVTKEADPKNFTRLKNGVEASRRIWSLFSNVEWAFLFMISGVVNARTGETPKWVEQKATTPVVDSTTFEIPWGMSADTISGLRAIDQMKQNGGYGFMEVVTQLEPPDDPNNQSREVPNYKPKATITYARQDPLKRAFVFGDYKDRILFPRVSGQPRLDWYAGVFSDDTLSLYKRGEDAPHLLIAAESGGGKSVLVASMLAQKIHNNHPDDYELWLIEPKTELQVWEDVDVVTHFVDSWTPNNDFMENVALLLEEAQEEMERRNAAMRNWRAQTGVQVRDIDQARAIAMSESKKNGTPFTQHPLWFRYIDVVIEECASIYGDVGPDDKAAQVRALRASSELARKSRSAGIFLTWITQYPTNASIPMILRQMAARIGLKVKSGLASNIIIEENGLERIKTRGVGMVRDPKTQDYRRFRAFWVRDGVRADGQANDLEDLLDTIPQRPRAIGGGSIAPSAPATVGIHHNNSVSTGGASTAITLPNGYVPRVVPDIATATSAYAIWDSKYSAAIAEADAMGKQTYDSAKRAGITVDA